MKWERIGYQWYQTKHMLGTVNLRRGDGGDWLLSTRSITGTVMWPLRMLGAEIPCPTFKAGKRLGKEIVQYVTGQTPPHFPVPAVIYPHQHQ